LGDARLTTGGVLASKKRKKPQKGEGRKWAGFEVVNHYELPLNGSRRRLREEEERGKKGMVQEKREKEC